MSKKILRGLDLKGTVRVFTKSKEVVLKSKKKVNITDVWTNMSYKVADDEYLQAPLKLTFGRDARIPKHNTDIEVEGFLTVSGNPGYERLAMFVQSWKEVGKEDPETEEVESADIEDEYQG